MLKKFIKQTKTTVDAQNIFTEELYKVSAHSPTVSSSRACLKSTCS